MIFLEGQSSTLSLACCLHKNNYSFAVLDAKNELIVNQFKSFNESEPDELIQSLQADVEHNNLIGEQCQLILLPGQYQLILMDAPNVPEEEIAKALRWELGGLSQYPLEDVLIDAFLVPQINHSPRKAFVALVSNTELTEKRKLFQQAYLEVISVGIAEFAIRNFLIMMIPNIKLRHAAPLLIISLNTDFQKIYLIYQDEFYLIRELTLEGVIKDNKYDVITINTEIERSINFCLSQLNLPDPRQVFFTPDLSYDEDFFNSIKSGTGLEVIYIDLNNFYTFKRPLQLDEQPELFYSIAGGLVLK